MATPPKIRTELTYTMNLENLDDGGLEKIAKLVSDMSGARKQALSTAPRMEIETFKHSAYGPDLSFVVILSSKSTIDLANGLAAYIDQAGMPYSAKGAYDVVEQVLRKPKFNKTLKPNRFSFFTGKEIVDLPKTGSYEKV